MQTSCLAEHAHAAAEAGAAGGGGNHAAGFGKHLEKTFAPTLVARHQMWRARRCSAPLGNAATLHHARGYAQVFDAGVGAGADISLIDGIMPYFADKAPIEGKLGSATTVSSAAHRCGEQQSRWRQNRTCRPCRFRRCER